MQNLQFKQQDEQRAQQKAVLDQQAAIAAAHKADYENFLQENPQQKPMEPARPA